MKKKQGKHKDLTKYYIILFVLTLVILLLIIVFINLNSISSEDLNGLPSLNLWKPFGNLGTQLNLSENNSAFEKTRQIETPSDSEAIKFAAKRYWISFITLLLIVVLLIAWVMVIFKIYNG